MLVAHCRRAVGTHATRPQLVCAEERQSIRRSWRRRNLPAEFVDRDSGLTFPYQSPRVQRDNSVGAGGVVDPPHGRHAVLDQFFLFPTEPVLEIRLTALIESHASRI